MVKNVAVIPARGGSTRLIDKNIYPLQGKPLIRWATESVLESGCFDSVWVSTDSDAIFDAVCDLGVKRHERPEILATTKSTVLDAMLDLAELLKIKEGDFCTFSYFLPTCPFVGVDDIKNGFGMLKASETDFVVSMTEIPETIQLACNISETNEVLPIFDNLEQGITNSKFIKKYHKPSGAFYMSQLGSLLFYRNFFKGTTRGVIVPKERSVDINDIYDIKYAESLLNDTSI